MEYDNTNPAAADRAADRWQSAVVPPPQRPRHTTECTRHKYNNNNNMCTDWRIHILCMCVHVQCACNSIAQVFLSFSLSLYIHIYIRLWQRPRNRITPYKLFFYKRAQINCPALTSGPGSPPCYCTGLQWTVIVKISNVFYINTIIPL